MKQSSIICVLRFFFAIFIACSFYSCGPTPEEKAIRNLERKLDMIQSLAEDGYYKTEDAGEDYYEMKDALNECANKFEEIQSISQYTEYEYYVYN